MEPRPRQTRAGLAAAMLVLLVFSLAAAWGRKPPKEDTVRVTTRPLSTSEIMAILHKFPEMVPGYLASLQNDTNGLASIFGFVEVTAAPLTRVFPTARFYLGHYFNYSPPPPYLMAIDGGGRYPMPSGFGLLLRDNGLKVTDKNIIELAKPLVVAAIGIEHHEITFLGAKKKKLEEWATDAAQLKVRIDGKEEEWHFDVLRNQFDGASSVDEKGNIRDYYVAMPESHPLR